MNFGGIGQTKYPSETMASKTILGAINRTIQVMKGMFTSLKKIEYHLSLGTDTDLKDQDVDK